MAKGDEKRSAKAPTTTVSKRPNEGSTKTASSRQRVKLSSLTASAPFGALVVVLCGIWISVYRKYGLTMFLGHKAFDLKHTPTEWKQMLANKTILLIGGPHRGGTTLLWEIVTAHPAISGLGSTFATGVDYSEGILLQTVYPRMGVGLENLQRHQRTNRKPTGVGRYALDPASHLLPTDPLVSPQNYAKLLNRFGAYWNLSKPILAEKSPPTAVMSRFLEALYTVPVQGDEHAAAPKFLFVTRHPIANALAHYNLLGPTTSISLNTLLRNYVQMHTYLYQDMAHLQNTPLLVRLEDLCHDTQSVLTQIGTWLWGPDHHDAFFSVPSHMTIRPHPNAKYRTAYCSGKQGRNDDLQWVQDAVDKWGLGYNVTGWCDVDPESVMMNELL